MAIGALELQIEYRPVRIGWCVRDGSLDELEKALRLSCCLWGGMYNPVIPVGPGREPFCQKIVESFRLTTLYAVDATAKEPADFIKAREHLPWPLFEPELFKQAWADNNKLVPAMVDVLGPARTAAKERVGLRSIGKEFRHLTWDEDDPVRYALLAQFGGYPSPEAGYPDYASLLRHALSGANIHLGKGDGPPADGMFVPTPWSVTSLHLKRMTPTHYAGNFPGFYIGDCSSFADIVNFWNLRAAGIELAFCDQAHAARLTALRDAWFEALKARPRGRFPELTDRISVWASNQKTLDQANMEIEFRSQSVVDDWTFVSSAAQPCVVVGPGQGVLASLAEDEGRPVVAFQLPDRPFVTDEPIVGLQHHVVGVHYQSPREYGLPEEYTLNPPHVPTVNRFLGLECRQFAINVRSDLNDIGVVVSSSYDSLTLGAVNKRRYAEAVFRTLGIAAKPSQAGLVAARVIGQMGGLEGCRVFKIRGVRELIGKYSPSRSFSFQAAMRLIGPTLNDHKGLTIDRDQGGELRPPVVFDYLLKKEVVQVGLELDCPNCHLSFWKHLDDARVMTKCEYCRHEFNVARQLKDRGWAYRRSGIFGRGDDQLGAVPVVLVMQQLLTHLSWNNPMILPSIELAGGGIPPCETDLVVFNQPTSTLLCRSPRVQVVLGECKTTDIVTPDDADNLLRVAVVLENAGFQVFVIFAKLAEFGAGDIAACRRVNCGHYQRAIMLGPAELEPYWMPDAYGPDMLERLAGTTDKRYFAQTQGGPAVGAEARTTTETKE